MNTQLIIDWINSTRQINNSKKEYFSFVQLYFLLNHVFKELSTLNNLSYHEDVKIMTLAFPTVVNTNWNTVNANQQIKDDIKFIQFLMFKNIDFAISKNFYSRKSENNLFTEIIKIGYHDDIHSYNSNHNLTKSEIKHYNTILTFEKVSQQKTFKFLQDTLIILYAIRNNYYHGEKQQIEGQIDLLFYLNFVIIKILKIVFSVQNQLNDASISTEINNIEQNYNSILTDKLKKELKERFRNNQTDFREWEDSANSGNPYFRFAHNFIIIEKFNNIIIKTLNNKNDEIINSIKRIETYFNIKFLDENQKKLGYYQTEYRVLKNERNKIFHGNNNIQLNSTVIQEINVRLTVFIKQIDKWLKNIINYHTNT